MHEIKPVCVKITWGNDDKRSSTEEAVADSYTLPVSDLAGNRDLCNIIRKMNTTENYVITWN